MSQAIDMHTTYNQNIYITCTYSKKHIYTHVDAYTYRRTQI